MLYARDFRAIARDRMKNGYWVAVLVTFIAGLLGGTVSSMSGAPSVTGTSNIRLDQYIDVPEVLAILQSPRVLAILAILSIWSIAIVLIGGAVSVGLCRYNLRMIDRGERSMGTLWSGFSVFGKALGVVLLSALYTFLWTLLFVIPGIIAAYRYSQALFVLAEDPSVGVNEAITISKRMMQGNKWRLFCLGFSFIGWTLLASLPGTAAATCLSLYFITGIGSAEVAGIAVVLCFSLSYVALLCLNVYQNAAVTAFYLEVSGQSTRLDVEIVEH